MVLLRSNSIATTGEKLVLPPATTNGNIHSGSIVGPPSIGMVQSATGQSLLSVPVINRQNNRLSGSRQRDGRTPRSPMMVTSTSASPLITDHDDQQKEEIEESTQNLGGQKRKYAQSMMHNGQLRLVTVDTSKARSNAPVLKICLDTLGWKECPNGREDGRPCDIYWHAFVYAEMKDIVKTGRVNKFPGMSELAKKISLTRALSSMQKLFPDQYDFYPRSWFIPSQLHEFYEDYYATTGGSSNPASSSTDNNNAEPLEERMMEKSRLWFIAKPDDGAQGENIYLIQNPGQLQHLDQAQIVQTYVAEPYLMQDRLKFDLRIYCVIRSLNPLTIYIAREGMARFCTQQYRLPSASNASRAFMHLTNYSLNKQNQQGFVHAKDTTEQGGSKRLLSTVFHQMEARGVDTRKIWHDIKTIVVKTVLALVPELILRYENQYYGGVGPQCFHILGFDIILDKNLRPILLEINACPSLSIAHEDAQHNPGGISVVDEAIKVPLVKDTLQLVMDRLADHRRPAQQDGGSGGGGGAYSAGMRQSASTASQLHQLPGVSGQNQNTTTKSNQSTMKKHGADDSELANLGQRSCLSEIFPTQFGYTYAPLLVLDKAAYFFMQCVNIRKTVEISMSGCRNFVKKCSLNDLISQEELDALYSQISREWISQYTQGLPFYGFVELLMVLASRKYPKANCLLDAVRSLFQYCETQIRYHGVRSSRLRADAVADQNHHQVKDLYLLPYHRKGSSIANGSAKRRSSSSVSLPKIV